MSTQEQTHTTALDYIIKNQNTGPDLCREDEFIAALLEIVDAKDQRIIDLQKIIDEDQQVLANHVDQIVTKNKEIARLTDLVNRESWAPLDMVAGGPGSPGYDDEPYLEPIDKDIEFPAIEEWRLPEKDR